MKLRLKRASFHAARKNNSADYHENDLERMEAGQDEKEDDFFSSHGLRHWQGVAMMLALYDVIAVNLAYFLSSSESGLFPLAVDSI